MAYGDPVKQPSLPFVPEGDPKRDLVESSRLQHNLDRLLAAIGDRGTCKGCNAAVTWVQHKNTKKAPYDADGTNHFATCPKREQFKR